MKKKVKPKKVDEQQLKDITEKAKQQLDEQKRVAEQMIKDQQELLLTDTKYNQEQFFNKVNSIKEPLKEPVHEEIEPRLKQVQPDTPNAKINEPVLPKTKPTIEKPIRRVQPVVEKPVAKKPVQQTKPVQPISKPAATNPVQVTKKPVAPVQKPVKKDTVQTKTSAFEKDTIFAQPKNTASVAPVKKNVVKSTKQNKPNQQPKKEQSKDIFTFGQTENEQYNITKRLEKAKKPKFEQVPYDNRPVVKPAKPVVKEQPKKVTTKTAPKVQSKVEQKYIIWTQKPQWNPNLQDMFDAAKSNTKNINKAATNIQKRTNKINQQQGIAKPGLVKNNTQSNKNDVKSSIKTSTGVQVYTSQQSYKLNLDKLSKKDAFPQVTEKLKQLREIKNKRSLQAGDSKNTNLEAIQDHKKRFNIKTPYWYVDKETNQALYFDGNVSFYRPVYVYNVATGKGKDDTDMYRKWDGDYKRIAKEGKNSSGAGVYVVDKVEKGSSYGLKRSGERAYKGSNDGEPVVRLRGVGHGMRVAMAMHASPSPKADKDFKLPNSERNTTSGCIRFEVNELRKAYDEGRLFEGDTVYVKPHNKKSYMYEHEGEIKTHLSLNKDVKDKLIKNRIKPKVGKYSKRYKHYNAVLYNSTKYNKK